MRNRRNVPSAVRVDIHDGQDDWQRAGELLARRDPGRFARLLAVATAAASLFDDDLEDDAQWGARVAAMNMQGAKS